jgi:hypothetical protein
MLYGQVQERLANAGFARAAGIIAEFCGCLTVA